MSRRRRLEDDSDDSRSQKRRRTTTDQNEIEERLESLITRVGEKSTSSLESNLEGLAGVLQADLPNYKNKIIGILCVCSTELPEKLSVYTTLVGLINAKNYECGGDFSEEMWRRLKELMKQNEWDRCRLLVRFIADLVNCRVVDVSSMVQLYEAFVAVTLEEGIPQVRSDWFVYTFLSSLPWVGQEIAEKKEEELDKMLSVVETYMTKRKKDHIPMLRVWHSDTPHVQEDSIDCLWAQTCKLRRDDWNHKSILRPYLSFDSILCEALQHTLPQFTVPPHNEECVYPLPKVIFRMFDYTDAPEGPTMPGHHSIERYLVEEQLSCIISAYVKDRKECAAQLVSYHGKARVPLNYMIVEVMFGQLFNLPHPVKQEAAYASLLLELCKLQPSSLPQVLAQATELLYERLDNMNLNCIDRFVNWFSHHLSNFQFRWSWDEWADCVSVDPEMPRPKFVREVLVKCMRLSYHQRIVESIPNACTEAFESLLPKPPVPIYKYNEEGAGSLPGTMIAHKLMDTIKARATTTEVLAVLDDVPNPTQAADSMEDESTFNPLKIDIFVQTLLFLGQKSFSHSFSALAKFHPVFKTLADSEESQIYVLEMVRELWVNHQQMIGVLIDKMLRTQIVSCPAVINWLFSGSMSKEFTKYYVWEIIHATLRKMSKHVGKIETELQEARDKSNKKKRVDMESEEEEEEEDSDEDPGDIDAEIERLQESLETAQSEQKNLFLIIFQRFIMILTEHIATSENRGVAFRTPWYNYCIQRLQQIFLMHYNQVRSYRSTLEGLLFTGDTDPNILNVFQQFCSLSS
ncbi:nuclear cap-binding protein subunit 1-like [Asterias rubens]|uniref:nuclear cap-binding protein subunit 1-like n=1 Tax=Asterias rubens TaxID=7604 RepID=UPI0014554FF7|nr:nuclear cap-binding protein subunit 1-like [Asterias rubens]